MLLNKLITRGASSYVAGEFSFRSELKGADSRRSRGSFVSTVSVNDLDVYARRPTSRKKSSSFFLLAVEHRLPRPPFAAAPFFFLDVRTKNPLCPLLPALSRPLGPPFHSSGLMADAAIGFLQKRKRSSRKAARRTIYLAFSFSHFHKPLLRNKG